MHQPMVRLHSLPFLLVAAFALAGCGGSARVDCPRGTICGGACVDTKEDRLNCGDCGQACAAGQICNSGQCASPCVTGLLACNGRCVDPLTDTSNCGACGASCADGKFCSAGT